MKQIDIKQINDNVFETIGKEWILVAAGNKDKFNMMTASWGCLGWLWNKPVAVVFIRPERFTHELIEANDTMTLSFLGHSEEARKIYNFCGSKSGRDLDKCEATGLKPVVLEGGSIGFEQARLTLDCRKRASYEYSSIKAISSLVISQYLSSFLRSFLRFVPLTVILSVLTVTCTPRRRSSLTGYSS